MTPVYASPTGFEPNDATMQVTFEVTNFETVAFQASLLKGATQTFTLTIYYSLDGVEFITTTKTLTFGASDKTQIAFVSDIGYARFFRVIPTTTKGSSGNTLTITCSAFHSTLTPTVKAIDPPSLNL